MASLISTHLITIDAKQPFGDMKIANYNNELLNLANDLGTRLLYAFDNQNTHLPYPRVNIKKIYSSAFFILKPIKIFSQDKPKIWCTK